MRVLIPMAGRGDRFVDKGYTNPKPLIKVIITKFRYCLITKS